MCAAGRRWGRRQRVLLWGVLLAAWEAAWGQLRYSVPEEMPKGSFVGDVAKDLGLQMPELRDRGARVVTGGRTQYFALHGKTGHLVTAERVDREQLCRLVEQCVLRCELIVDGETKVYEIEVEITDINDNAPTFKEIELQERISEMTSNEDERLASCWENWRMNVFLAEQWSDVVPGAKACAIFSVTLVSLS
ncbi:protocadherin gamma-A12-like [Pipra filicauda]|uniref:Protocadherin gamma-A12-like n=1 Tax=Pipra filicauda TaxID=649802 RepID=A0A7R5KBD5_9PASS|nr:protocadherin gamma-A12-like [Pipra filicauda]